MHSSLAVAKVCHDCGKELGFWVSWPKKEWKLPDGSMLCSPCWRKHFWEHDDAKLRKQLESVSVDLLDGEKILWQDHEKEGILNRKVTDARMITNYRVISNRDAVDIVMIEDAVLANKRVETTGGDVRTRHSDGYSISRQDPIVEHHFADIVFVHGGNPLVVFPDVKDPERVAAIFRVAKKDVIERLTPEDEGKNKPTYVRCPHCSTMNLPADACNVCGKPLNPLACAGCKAENPLGSRFCAACGAEMTVL
jgi:hypothetical protein